MPVIMNLNFRSSPEIWPKAGELHRQLVKVKSVRVLWTAKAHDPRIVGINPAAESSVEHTVEHALKLLAKDLNITP